MDTVARMAASGDYVALPDEEHYRIYFDQIRGVCETLQNWAESSMGKASPEGTCVRMFSDQILQSIELLRLKYLVDKRDSLKLDLNESGFPHFNEISKLENDAKNAGERLQSIPLHVMLALTQCFVDEGPNLSSGNIKKRQANMPFKSKLKADFCETRRWVWSRRSQDKSWECSVFDTADFVRGNQRARARVRSVRQPRGGEADRGRHPSQRV